ncbi:hypothetical protein VF13_40220 [Nostoc linckia z16]|nr:hypothetical protein VF13_40220 [Nostoc linckia z16]
MKHIDQLIPTEEELLNTEYNYQAELTAKLDLFEDDFTQDTINEIVLWKINRFTALDSQTLNLLNQISKDDRILNLELTKEVLTRLLHKQQKGIRLAMASTILRFKNPSLYQIIDQRVYRFLYGRELLYSVNDTNQQIDLYLDYLTKLREVSETHRIAFEQADRVFYSMDKTQNSELKLKGYGRS